MKRVMAMGCLSSLLVLLHLIGAATSTPSCTTVFTEVTPCLSYLRGGDAPSSACCNGVKHVSGQIQSKGDRQAVCECLKGGLSKAGSYDPNKIPQLPAKCGVSINLPPVTPSTDCATA